MDSLNLCTKVIAEINLVPEDKLEELYNFIHYFRLGVEVYRGSINPTMEFAGCWNDISDEGCANFNEEISTRSQQAFSGRRIESLEIQDWSQQYLALYIL
jgi:hypothetical protein